LSPILGIIASQDYVRIPPSSFESIATVTATGSQSSLTFTSIPGTYKSLQVRCLSRDGTATGSSLRLQFNSDTGNNYAWHLIFGDGTSVSAPSGASTNIGLLSGQPYTGSNASIFGATIIDIYDYASTTKNKTVNAIGGFDTNNTTGGGSIRLISNLWVNTSAITTINLFNSTNNFASGTTFALYGIK
jgi:hypothetical protein